MDRSVDSIGSCSLDVDADSTDFSDTSGSLNLATPSSAKDITKEFTLNIRERCEITRTNCQQSTTILDPYTGKINTIITKLPTPEVAPTKKPSYLNLACCVNGYSNLTTYDSKLRQNINKSREVSPIRPSAKTFQYCKTLGNLLAPPVPLLEVQKQSAKDKTMDNNSFTQNTKILIETESVDKTDHIASETYYRAGKFISSTIMAPSEYHQSEAKTKSFIQQRVERLYGPGALAQGFYSPKKGRTNNVSVFSDRKVITSEQCSFLNQEELNGRPLAKDFEDIENSSENLQNSNDLPVLRHLRPEFRAQLPILSPKKSQTKTNEICAVRNGLNSHENESKEPFVLEGETEVFVDVKNSLNVENSSGSVTPKIADSVEDIKLSEFNEGGKNSGLTMTKNGNGTEIVNDSSQIVEKNGNYFLKILRAEQDRLLRLAAEVEKDIDMLADTDVSDEVMGYLRSASGKARLLVSKKMKQFEGLCINNLNAPEDEKFPTTNEDLEGFWDMVKLQVRNVDSLFKDIENMKQNSWQRSEESIAPPTGTKLVKRPITRRANGSAPVKAVSDNGAVRKKLVESSSAAQKREEQRKQFLENKRKNKIAITAASNQSQNNTSSVEIFVSEHCS